MPTEALISFTDVPSALYRLVPCAFVNPRARPFARRSEAPMNCACVPSVVYRTSRAFARLSPPRHFGI